MKTMLHRIATLLCFILMPFLLWGQIQKQVKWEEYSSFQSGYGGGYAGVSNEAILYAGGFDSSENRYSDQIFIVDPSTNVGQPAIEKLPFPMAFGLAVSFGNWIIIAGGQNGERYFNSVYAIKYQSGRVEKKTLASLPFPLAHMSGCIVGHQLFIAGGDTSQTSGATNSFLMLDLRSVRASWQQLPGWPGASRLSGVSASLYGNFFLTGGNSKSESRDEKTETIFYKDSYQFIPGRNKITGGEWIKLPDAPISLTGAANPAPTIGLDHILFVGGKENPKGITGYNAASKSWIDFGSLPVKNSLAYGLTVPKNNQWMIINTTASQTELFALSKRLHFGWINWLTLIAYLALMVWIGFVHNRREQSAKNFFTAGGRIPWWAAGLSIYGSQISAITFMAVPAIVFATDWSLAIGSILVFAVIPIVIKYFVPFFRRLNVTTAYEYLELRFSRTIQLMGSIAFILFQLGRMGIVLYLPAAAISAVTGINIYLLVSIMGVICILYSVVGGIEAVVWTDVAQVVILLGGAVLCFFVAVLQIDGGFGAIFSEGMKAHKFDLYDLGLKPDHLVLWVCVVGFFFLNVIPYTSDQTVIQRYLTVSDEKKAAKSLWINAWISLPGTIAFFGLGTVLYVFYKFNPQVIASESVGEVLPYFVVQQLPAGLSGLVMAGIFAASQSSLSASMNSVAASFFADIGKSARWGRSSKNNLGTVRKITVGAGIFGTFSAISISAFNVAFVFDLFQEFLGILGGSFSGVFILGIFTKRSNATGVLCGIITSVLIVWLIKTQTSISVYLYGAISVVVCVIVGYVASCLVPSAKNVEGLYYGSIQSLKKNKEMQQLHKAG